MASTSKDIPITKPPNLNYVEVKRNYFNTVASLLPIISEPLSTRKSVEEAMTRIRFDSSLVQDLSIKTVSGKEKLFVKRLKNFWKEVVPVEDSFNIMLDAHLECGHGDATETYNAVKNIYSVHILSARWLVESCNVCNSSQSETSNVLASSISDQNINNSRPRGKWRLNVIKDVNLYNSSERVSLLLILKEDTTNFLILRALYESSEGFALELMKIFTEFGYPEKVCVPNMYQFYQKIFLLVSALNPAEIVPIEEVASDQLTIFEKDKGEVLIEIRKWMAMMDDIYWEQCCHIVQYKLNTTKKILTRLYDSSNEKCVGIPYNQFFEHRFKTKMTWIPSPFVKKQTE